MKPQLQRELINFPINKHPGSISHHPEPSSHRTTQQNNAFKHIKQLIFVTMTVLFLVYRWLPSGQEVECIVDLAHEWTMSLNRVINTDQQFYQFVIIIAQQSIQINIFLICILSTWHVNNLRPHLHLALFFGIRGILLNIQGFPYPPNIRWDQPIIPSLTVPYGITRDYFYSGHTGLMVFSTLWWRYLGYRWLFYPNLFLTPFVIMVLLATRVHYSIDIVAAIIFTFWLHTNVSRYVFWFDRAWSCVLLGLTLLWNKFRSLLS